VLGKRSRPPYQVYLGLQAASPGFYLLVTTVAAVFCVEKAHLNALQLLLVGTTLEATCLVFQVPTEQRQHQSTVAGVAAARIQPRSAMLAALRSREEEMSF
jgi:hypothetical protein